ncbi:Yip1 family protein [Roseobacteraceae bacterium S113]
MNFTVQGILEMVARSLRDPQAVARELMGMGIPDKVRWPGLVAVVLVGTLLSGVLNMLAPAQGPFAAVMESPFRSAFFSFAIVAFLIFGLHWAGQMFGGQGRLADMVLVMTWFQVVTLVLQLGVIVLTLVLPPLAVLAGLALVVLSVWLSVAFVDTVHGFDNLLKSLGVIVFAFIAIGFGLSIMLTLIGVNAEGMLGSV